MFKAEFKKLKLWWVCKIWSSSVVSVS